MQSVLSRKKHVFSCSDKVEACGTSPLVGYTEAHVPVASTPLDDMYDATLIAGDDQDAIGSDLSVDCTLFLGETRYGSSVCLRTAPCQKLRVKVDSRPPFLLLVRHVALLEVPLPCTHHIQ